MKTFLSLLVGLLMVVSRAPVLGADAAAPEDALDALVLLDGQGLWGGSNLWLRRDGTGFAQVVKPPDEGERGMQEGRWALQLSKAEIAAVNEILRAQAFSTIRTKDRPGVPDESHPVIWVRNQAGKSAAAMKWGRDQHKEFDAIYKHLKTLVEAAKRGTPIYKGAHDSKWMPEGFPKSAEMRNLAVKDSKIHQ